MRLDSRAHFDAILHPLNRRFAIMQTKKKAAKPEYSFKYVLPNDDAALAKIKQMAFGSLKRSMHAMQVLCVAILHRAMTTGRYQMATEVIEEAGNGVNGAALVEWFRLYGGFVPGAKGFVGWSGKKHIEENFEAAKATPWWTTRKANAFKGYDATAALQAFLTTHNNTLKKMKDMSPEDRAKVNLIVDSSVIDAVLRVCNFEVADNKLVYHAPVVTEPTAPVVTSDATAASIPSEPVANAA
jgi:hypothetical protein